MKTKSLPRISLIALAVTLPFAAQAQSMSRSQAILDQLMAPTPVAQQIAPMVQRQTPTPQQRPPQEIRPTTRAVRIETDLMDPIPLKQNPLAGVELKNEVAPEIEENADSGVDEPPVADTAQKADAIEVAQAEPVPTPAPTQAPKPKVAPAAPSSDPLSRTRAIASRIKAPASGSMPPMPPMAVAMNRGAPVREIGQAAAPRYDLDAFVIPGESPAYESMSDWSNESVKVHLIRNASFAEALAALMPPGWTVDLSGVATDLTDFRVDLTSTNARGTVISELLRELDLTGYPYVEFNTFVVASQ